VAGVARHCCWPGCATIIRPTAWLLLPAVSAKESAKASTVILVADADMLYDAFDGKAEYFILDDLDAQKLYNAARNIEIAAWKLANARRAQPEADSPAGAPILLSNEMVPVQNLSFEREFGRLIGSLDLLVQIATDKSNRTVVKVVQNLATAAFLPIK